MELDKPKYINAVKSLVGGSVTGLSDGPISELHFNNSQTPPSEEDIQIELASMIAEWDAQAYARNRRNEYPDTGEQFNKIYDDGLTKWKSEMVDPVKTKWPKDNSGPVE